MIEKFEHHVNTKFANFSVTYVSNGVQDIILNVTVENKSLIRKLVGYAKIMLPESPDDNEFKKEFFRVTIDHEKLLKGAFGGFIMRTFMENVKSSLDTEIKFPVKKVNLE